MTSDWRPGLLSEEMVVDPPEVLQHIDDPSSHGRKSQSAQVFDEAERSALQQTQMRNAYQQHGYFCRGNQDQRYVMSGDVSLTPSLIPPQYRQEEPLPTTSAASPDWAVSQMRHAQALPVGQTQTPSIRRTESPHQLVAHHTAAHNPNQNSTGTALAANQTVALNLTALIAQPASSSHSWLAATQQPQLAPTHARPQQSSPRGGLPLTSKTPASHPPLPTTTPGHPMPTPVPPVEQTRGNKRRRLQPNQHPLRPSPPSRNNLRTRSDLIQRIKPEDAQVRTEYDPATIARDVLINSGKHPTEKFLNEHLKPLRKNFDFVDYYSDLSTFRWDIVDPVVSPAVPVAKGTSSHVPASRDRPRSPARVSATRPLPKETPSLVSHVNPPLSHTHPHPPQSLPTHSIRPPPPASTPSQQTQAETTPKPSPAKPRHSPQSKDTSQLEAVHLSSLHSMPPQGMAGRAPPKKKAEDDTTDDKAQVGKAQDVEAPLIDWPVFACRWTKCPAELHNLETLRRHIVKLHIPANIKCGWEACKNQEGMPANELWQHVQESHISPVAWKLGDGPRIHLPGKTA
ncbi:hypothetical protein N7510_008046 [Penicillium lagena]|uniref:uncharacterized protein n=1 Tax=Penicillium lagena TaxID=94218 RepID=UPI00254098C1|nr:uncharacterized protein N7510_008046 [Penicillium lagena]KAJ5611327.1 hypothetical protein N7510_008046 [Penicillium lagena]